MIRKTMITSVVNQKGGVGKTTTVVNLSHAVGKKDRKVLVIDMDPQCNASQILGTLSPFQQPKTIVDIFTTKSMVSDCIVATKYKNVDLISSHMNLFSVKTQITGATDGIVGLKRKLDSAIYDKYDFVFIDCQPDMCGPLVINALVASDNFIVPIAAEDVFGLQGIKQLETSVQTIQESINDRIKMLAVLITMSDNRSNASEMMISNIKTYFKEGDVFKTIIKRNAAINSAFIKNKSVIAHDGRTPGAMNYNELATEFLEKVI